MQNSELDKAKQNVANALQVLKEAEDELNAVANKDPLKEMAELLHEHMCKFNHTMGCDWHDGAWNDDKKSERIYVAKAQQILDLGISYSDMDQIVKILKLK